MENGKSVLTGRSLPGAHWLLGGMITAQWLTPPFLFELLKAAIQELTASQNLIYSLKATSDSGQTPFPDLGNISL